MSCTDDKFVINKGLTNEFTITIKQNDTTLPMEIIAPTRTISTNHTVQPVTNLVPEVLEVIAVDEVAAVPAVPEVPYVPETLAVKEEYVIVTGFLDDNAGAGTTYNLYIDAESFPLTYTVAAYPEPIDYILALAAEINHVTTGSAIVDAVVDDNKIILTEKTATGTGYTVNGSTVYDITETASSVAYVAEVPFVAEIPAVEFEAAIIGVNPYPSYYSATNEALTIQLTDFFSTISPFYTIGSTLITITDAIADLKAGGVSITPTGNVYDIGTNSSFEIYPVVDNTELVAPLATIAADIVTNLNAITPDTFVASLYLLSDGQKTSFDPTVDIVDSFNGQIKITFQSADVDTLVSLKGEVEDRYYLKPSYRLAIDCTTENNGNFIAKVPNVYVE